MRRIRQFLLNNKKIAIGIAIGLWMAAGVTWAQTTLEWPGNFQFRNTNPVISYNGTLAFQTVGGTAVWKIPASGTPTCAVCSTIVGTDMFSQGTVAAPFPGSTQPLGNSGNGLIVTFANTWTTAPSCVATRDGNGTYGYYVYGVTTTTTTATIRLGGSNSPTPAAGFFPSWSPFDKFSLVCGSTS